MSKGRGVALGVVIVIHVMLGWAFSAGLAPKFIKTIIEPMQVEDIEEAPPPEEEPPPPPPQELVEIPPYVPPPDLPIELPPPPAPPPITAQQTVQQTAPTRVVAPPPANPAPVAQPAVNRVPAKASRRNVISEDDYPSASLRNEEEGVTRVRFTINTDGRVEQCSVVESSGHPRLDEKTCDLVRRRFRFEPATENGKPVEETRTQSVKWQIRR